MFGLLFILFNSEYSNRRFDFLLFDANLFYSRHVKKHVSSLLDNFSVLSGSNHGPSKTGSGLWSLVSDLKSTEHSLAPQVIKILEVKFLPETTIDIFSIESKKPKIFILIGCKLSRITILKPLGVIISEGV